MASHTIRPVLDDPNLVSAAGLVPALRLADTAGLHDLLEQRLRVDSSIPLAKAVCGRRDARRHNLRHIRVMADLGFDADFLNIALAPTATPDDDTGTDPMRTRLDHAHVTVRMHRARQLEWVVRRWSRT